MASVDIEAFARNAARMIEEGGKALAAYMQPREDGKLHDERAEEVTDVVKTLGHVLEYWLADPQRALEMQIAARQVLSRTVGGRRPSGWPASRRAAGRRSPIRRTSAFPIRNGRRTSSSTFSSRPICSPSEWANHLVTDADGLDPHTRHKAEFYVRQIANALSPSNFV